MQSRMAALAGIAIVLWAGGALAQDRAGRDRLRANDVIVAIDGLSLTGCREDVALVARGLQAATAEDPLRVEIVRGGERSSVLMTAPLAREGPAQPAPRVLEGFELATLSRTLGSYFGAEAGVLVVHAPLRPDGASGRAALDLADGDVLLAIDGVDLRSSAQAWQLLGARVPGDRVQLVVLRSGQRMTLDTRMPR